MEYPEGWQRLFREHDLDIEAGKFTLYNPEDERNKKRTLGVVFKVPEDVADQIAKMLQQSTSENVKAKILFQPPEGFHFTIQWSPEEYMGNVDIAGVIDKLRVLLSKHHSIKGDLYLPFFGRAGLYGMLKTGNDQEIVKIRQDVHRLWEELGLPPGLNPKDYDLAYISTARYLKPFTPDEVSKLKSMPIQTIPDVALNEVWIVLNDKFMSPQNTNFFDKLTLED